LRFLSMSMVPIKSIKPIAFFILLAGLASIFFSCSESEPLRIGFVGSLTGKRSDIGVSERNAVQLYIDEVNAQGGINGKKVEIIVQDNKGDAAICETILNDFINDGIQFIIGPLFSQMAEAAMNSTKDKNVFLISPTMSTGLLSGLNDNIFRMAYSTNSQAQLLSDYFIAKDHQKAGVVYDLSNKKYTEPLYLEFSRRLQDNKIPIKFLETIKGDEITDFFNLAQKIQKADIDSLLLCLSATDAASLAQQLKKVDSKANLYGVSWTQSNDLIQYGGKAVEGMCLISIFKHKEKTKAHADFDRKFKEKYTKDPSFASIRAYDAAHVLITAMKNNEVSAPDVIKKSILKTKTFQGLDSSIVFDEFGDVAGQYSLVVIQDSSFTSVKFP
jgi:branched-chain amino acid transport system substrate-binding protein